MLAPRDLNQHCKAEITREMVEGILSMFNRAGQKTEVLTVELRGNVLSVLDPVTNEYEALGLARLPSSMAHLA